MPWEGRRRDDLSGFTCPAWTLSQQDEGLTIATEQLRVTVHQPLWLEWHYRNDAGEWQPLVNDVVDQRLPLTGVIAIVPLQPQRLMNGHTQLFGSNCQSLILLA